jgi:preprotein translocase subunit SecD
MKKILSSFFVLFLLAFIVWIDFPENILLRFTIGKNKISQTLNPPIIDLTLFGKQIHKDFRTRLGLDLKGGSHLVFDADVSDIPLQNRKDALESARNIIERRVNFFGVSEPNVQTIQSEKNFRIVVDLPGSQNIQEAVSLIGQTARLEFTEKNPANDKNASGTPDFILYNKKQN